MAKTDTADVVRLGSTISSFQSAIYASRDVIAGGVGGTIGALITCPLEVVKTKLQSYSFARTYAAGQTFESWEAAKFIWKHDGLKGFWRGIVPTIAGVAPSRAVYFGAYSNTRRFLIENNILPAASNLTALVSAATAGVSVATVMNPVWLVKTRLQLQSHATPGVAGGGVYYTSTANAVRMIYREEGLKGFWKGLSASYLGISETVIQLVLYERFKRFFTENKIEQLRLLEQSLKKNNENNDNNTTISSSNASHSLSGAEVMMSAAMAKFVACCLTYPHEVIRTRLREAPNVSSKYGGLFVGLRQIYIEEGVRGLYLGMGPHLLRTVPNAAIMFFTYEFVVKAFEKFSVS